MKTNAILPGVVWGKKQVAASRKINFKFYCPQSFSGGGLYSNGNGLLLWSVVGDCDYGVVCVVTVMILTWLQWLWWVW